MSDEPENDQDPQPSCLRFRIAFFLVGTVILAMCIMVPFAVRSLVDDLFSSVEGDVFTIVGTRAAGAERERNQLHIGMVDLDESRLKTTLRISAHRNCLPSTCPYGARLVLFSVGENEAATAGMPPSVKIDLPSGQDVVSQTLDLPIHGHPTLYPFDVYELRLGIGVAMLGPDGMVRPVTRQEAQGQLAVTVQDALAREDMAAPVHLAPESVQDSDDPYELQSLTVLRFTRPLHERVLAILLVTLVAAAAAYAVFMRPLHDLVINSGGLVLGVWGIRSLLTPGTASRTLVDLALSLVILFLLGAITFRALQFLYHRGEFRPKPKAQPSLAAVPASEAESDAAPARSSQKSA
ncbi:MAG: hypothetical protein U0893_08320 [Chloroflexota bacterium]